MDQAFSHSLAKPEVVRHPAWARVMKKYVQDRGAISFISNTLVLPEAMAHPEWSEVVDAAFKGFRSGDDYFVEKLLAHPEVRKAPNWSLWVDKIAETTQRVLEMEFGVNSYDRADARDTRAALLKLGVDCKAKFGALKGEAK